MGKQGDGPRTNENIEIMRNSFRTKKGKRTTNEETQKIETKRQKKNTKNKTKNPKFVANI